MDCNEKRFTGGEESVSNKKKRVGFHHKYAAQCKMLCQKPKHLLRLGGYMEKMLTSLRNLTAIVLIMYNTVIVYTLHILPMTMYKHNIKNCPLSAELMISDCSCQKRLDELIHFFSLEMFRSLLDTCEITHSF